MNCVTLDFFIHHCDFSHATQWSSLPASQFIATASFLRMRSAAWPRCSKRQLLKYCEMGETEDFSFSTLRSVYDPTSVKTMDPAANFIQPTLQAELLMPRSKLLYYTVVAYTG